MLHEIAFYAGASLFCGFPLIIALVLIVIGRSWKKERCPTCGEERDGRSPNGDLWCDCGVEQDPETGRYTG